MTANLAELVSRAASDRPEAHAIVPADGGEPLTWAALDDLVDRVAGGLTATGLVAGNRVVVAVGNRVELVVAYLAALRSRLVVVPVNPRAATGELVRIVADSGARLVLADATTVDPARAVVRGLDEALRTRPVVSGATGATGATGAIGATEPTPAPRLVVLDVAAEPGELAWSTLEAAAPVDLPAARDPEALAVLLYTSGTTATPRAAMLSHRALLANLDQAAAVRPPMVTRDDVVYGVLPLFHVYGLNAVLGQVLHQQARLVLADGFDPIGALRHVVEHGVTVLPVAPPVLHAWRDLPDLAERLAGVRLLLSGAAPLTPDLLTTYAERHGLTVHQGYGLTETAPVLTSTLCGAPDGAPGDDGLPGGVARPGSVGRPLPGVTLRLVDERGEPVAGSDPGEIQVSGDNLFSGYWPDGAGGPVDGWLATGDVGLLDDEGALVLVDRLAEVVVVSGFPVYPSEVEDVLLEVPDVREAVALGEPDPRTGEAVVAFLRTAEGADRDRVLDAARAACEARLARFKQPVRLEVLDALPRTVTGKVARGRLRELSRGAGEP